MERLINGRLKQVQKKIDSVEDSSVYSISDLARQIRKDWTKPNYAAVPYIEAMMSIHRVTDMYYEESAKSIVNYFLANAGTWRGEEAKRIKGILKKMVNG